jgi:predicted nuclease of predicted toxin-antitoxin system
MKLLLDENLSSRIVPQILDLFPGSSHVNTNGLDHTDDAVIWDFAGANGYTIVSKDHDFFQRSLLYGAPPKFLFLKVGNCTTREVTALIRLHSVLIQAFIRDPASSLLILP